VHTSSSPCTRNTDRCSWWWVVMARHEVAGIRRPFRQAATAAPRIAASSGRRTPWEYRCGQAWSQPRSAAQETKFPPRSARCSRKTGTPQIATSKVRSADTRRNSRKSTAPAAFLQTANGRRRAGGLRSYRRRSPSRSAVARSGAPSSISVATSATRRRESRARLRSKSKAVTASSWWIPIR
jgi:hypothetical protein